ncbi:hypothetical protein P4S68_01745 [Pseudoalteromonas sp. Hal099]
MNAIKCFKAAFYIAIISELLRTSKLAIDLLAQCGYTLCFLLLLCMAVARLAPAQGLAYLAQQYLQLIAAVQNNASFKFLAVGSNFIIASLFHPIKIS